MFAWHQGIFALMSLFFCFFFLGGGGGFIIEVGLGGNH